MAEVNNPRADELRDIAARLRDLLLHVAQSLQVKLLRLDGSAQEVSLAVAADIANVQPAEIRREAESIVIDARLRSHDRDSLSKERAHPESFREWFGALASGQLAVASASAIGVLASRGILVAIIAGVIGLSAQSVGTSELIERARSVELSLIAQASDADLAQAAQAVTAPSPSCTETGSCADDETTTQNLRVAFRAAAATALQRGVAATSARTTNQLRDSAFRLGAVDARRAILRQTSRPAAPTLDTGAEPVHYQSSAEPHATATGPDPLDRAFERRVQTLRSNEPTWRRLRAMAVHPVAPDYVADAWLRTAMGGLGGEQLSSVEVWSERASTEFTRTIVQTGDPEKALHAISSPAEHTSMPFGTRRDQRIFRDFSADAPDRVSSQLVRYDSGIEDPGSLRRTTAGATNGRHTSNLYDNLFPAVADTTPPMSPSSLDGGRGGSGVSGGGPSGGAGRGIEGRPTRVAARSFGSIRFSARVGGVVFGRLPDGNGKPPDVVYVRGQVGDSDKLYISVGMRNGTQIALGPYHPAVVHHALAYASDGRVVVSTLPMPYREEDQPFTIPARRVAVHPAFEDTAFACSAIQIDRFVDTFTNHSEGARARVLAPINRTREAVTIFGELLGPAGAKLDRADRISMLEMISSYSRACRDDSNCFPMKYYSGLGADFGPAMQFQDCLRQAESESQLESCWGQHRAGSGGVAYMVDSGVRERPYSIDPNLNFVSGRNSKQDELWPIEFMIQVIPIDENGDELAADLGEQHDPWQFPTISTQLQQYIAERVAADHGAGQTFRNIRDFVVLQRFFRTALDGQLGSEFPLSDLVTLSSQTRPFVQVRRNERWNVNSVLIEFLIAVERASERVMTQATPTASPACQAAISRVLEAKEGSVIPFREGFWEFMASFDRYCPDEPSLSDMQGLQRILRNQELIAEALALQQPQPHQAPLSCVAL